MAATDPRDPRLVQTHIAAQEGEFVGREHDLEALNNAFAHGDRLVTLVGPPGAGKTRLALRFVEVVTHAADAQMPLGEVGTALWCELPFADDEDAVLLAFGRMLAIDLDDPEPLARFAHALAARGNVLVVLDGLAGDVSGAARVLEHATHLCSEARWLCTSRAPLGLDGETALTVEPTTVARGGTAVTRPSTEAVALHDEEFLARTARHAARLEREGDGASLAWLTDSCDRLLGLARRAGDDRDTKRVRLQALLALVPVARRYGPTARYLTRAEAAFDAALEAGVPGVRDLDGVELHAEVRARRGDFTGALAHLKEGIRAARSHKDRVIEGTLQRAQALLDLRSGRRAEAVRHANSSLVALRGAATRAEVAVSLLALARALRAEARVDEARGVLREALTSARETGHGACEARCHVELGSIALDLGQHEEALEETREAIALYARQGDREGSARARCVMGRLLHDQGDLEEALGEFRAAVEARRAIGDRVGEARLGADLGAVLHELGQLSEARVLFERARDAFAPADAALATCMTAHLAAVMASRGLLQEAEAEAQRARETSFEEGDRTGLVVRALGVYVILSTARELPREQARAFAKSARHELAELRAAVPARAGVGVRLALRLAAGFEGDDLLRTSSDIARPSSLIVQNQGLWFSVPGGAPVSLKTRGPLALLLRRLARERTDFPGRSVSPEELIAAVWPGEKIIPKAARNRLHVAVRTLRTMGLETILRSDPGGYHLDPSVPFRTSQKTMP